MTSIDKRVVDDTNGAIEDNDSFLAPFHTRTFLVLWTATVISNIGTWMHDIGASWLMTSMTTSTTMVALIQTATMLPVFIFALPAGAIADMVDRRKMLLLIQSCLFCVVLLLVFVVYFNVITPMMLITFTFVIGIGTAFMAPTWQAIVPELVQKNVLTQAVALNGVGINISRAIGPALAGLIIVQLGTESVFLFNALSFLVVIFALLWWQRPQDQPSTLPKEGLASAMLIGLRYAQHSEPLKDTLVRALAFFFSASAFWALLPVVARVKLEASAESFGLMMAAIGVGAVVGSFALPKLKKRFKSGSLVVMSSCLAAVLLVATSFNQSLIYMFALSACFGASWIWVLASLNVSAQIALPPWVRARGLSVYLMVFFGSMSLGSLIWGGIADVVSIDTSLLIAGISLFIGVVMTKGFPLNQGESLDLIPANHWPEPPTFTGEDGLELYHRSPVMVTVEYHVEKDSIAAFFDKMQAMKEARLRYGAYQWSCLQDTNDPEIFIESFKELSWLNHLRHHKRVDGRDKVIQEQLRALTKNNTALVRHFVGNSN